MISYAENAADKAHHHLNEVAVLCKSGSINEERDVVAPGNG